MDAARRVLLVDGASGAVWLLLGALNAPGGSLASLWWVAAAGFAVAFAGLYGSEHGLFWLEREWVGVAVAGLLLLALPFGLAAALVTETDPRAGLTVGMIGAGVAVLCYRAVFGLLRPVPESRLERARERSV